MKTIADMIGKRVVVTLLYPPEERTYIGTLAGVEGHMIGVEVTRTLINMIEEEADRGIHWYNSVAPTFSEIKGYDDGPLEVE